MKEQLLESTMHMVDNQYTDEAEKPFLIFQVMRSLNVKSNTQKRAKIDDKSPNSGENQINAGIIKTH